VHVAFVELVELADELYHVELVELARLEPATAPATAEHAPGVDPLLTALSSARSTFIED